MTAERQEFSENEVRELLGGIGSATPGPLFLVDHVGRTHPLNGHARSLGEGDGVEEAFVSPVRLGGSRQGRVVGYTMPGSVDDQAALVSALVALAAGVVSRRLDPERRGGRPRDAATAVVEDACERLTTLLDERAVADVVATAALQATGARTAVLMLPDDDERLELAAMAGESPGAVAKVRPGRGLLGVAATRTDPTCVDSPWRVPGEMAVHEASRMQRCPVPPWLEMPLAAVPLLCGPQLAGLIVVTGLPAEPGARRGAEAARLLQRLADRAAASLAGAQVIRQVRREERVQRELEIARQIQGALLTGDGADFEGLDVAGECRPADQVGGDFFGFRTDTDAELTATLFDVAGHGIGAAFCMTLVRSALYGELARGGNVADVIERTNERVFDDVASSGLFATAFVARFDREAGLLRYASAGHAAPIHWSRSRRAFVEHGEGGLPLGLLPDADVPEGEAAFGEGDVFLAYTDGVVEATNASGEPFGRHRLLGIVHRSRRRSARALIRRVWRELGEFTGGRALPDDATLTVVRGRRGFGAPCESDRRVPRAGHAHAPVPARADIASPSLHEDDLNETPADEPTLVPATTDDSP